MNERMSHQRLGELKAVHVGWNGMSRNMQWWRRLLGEALAEVERLQAENEDLENSLRDAHEPPDERQGGIP